MDQEKFEEIRIVLDGVSGSNQDKARYLIDKHFPLALAVVEDWLKLDVWGKVWGGLTKDISEGHMTGPSPAAARALRRMRDKGHKITTIRGLFRWLDGGDDHSNKLYRRQIQIMLENGWVEMLPPDREGVDYVIFITDKGKHALTNTELDKRGDYWP